MDNLFPVTDEMRSISKSNYDNTIQSVEKLLHILKEKGITQMQALRLVLEEMKLSLSEADAIVMNCEVWKAEKTETIY